MVKETEEVNEEEACRSLLHKVVLPAPEGAEITRMSPFFFFSKFHPPLDGLDFLFNIDNLFSDSLQVVFYLNHEPGDGKRV